LAPHGAAPAKKRRDPQIFNRSRQDARGKIWDFAELFDNLVVANRRADHWHLIMQLPPYNGGLPASKDSLWQAGILKFSTARGKTLAGKFGTSPSFSRIL
jgi:hypothetical protein